MSEYEEVLGEKIQELDALGLPYSIHKNSPVEDGFMLNGYYVSIFTNDTWVGGGTHPVLADAIQYTLDAVGREGQK